MKTISHVLQAVQDDFGLTQDQRMDIEAKIEWEDISLADCKHALATMQSMRNRGKPITHPKGLFIAIAKKHNTKQETSEPETKKPKDNPMASPGRYDFWMGDRQISEATCQNIIWGWNSDSDDDRAMAIDLLIDCAPCLDPDNGELERTLAYADSEHTIGSWPLRLAQAVDKTIRFRNRTVTPETVQDVINATGVPIDNDSIAQKGSNLANTTRNSTEQGNESGQNETWQERDI